MDIISKGIIVRVLVWSVGGVGAHVLNVIVVVRKRPNMKGVMHDTTRGYTVFTR